MGARCRLKSCFSGLMRKGAAGDVIMLMVGALVGWGILGRGSRLTC